MILLERIANVINKLFFWWVPCVEITFEDYKNTFGSISL